MTCSIRDTLSHTGYLVLDNVFTHDECEGYKVYIDSLFDSEPDPEGLELDGYNRLRVKLPNLCVQLHTRLAKLLDLESQQIEVLPNWFPTKYITGGNLGIHIDGHANDGNLTSTHTVLIYLNGTVDTGSLAQCRGTDVLLNSRTHTAGVMGLELSVNCICEFTGGRTVFVDDYDSPMIVDESMPNSFIQPMTGRVLILDQSKLHYAEPVIEGYKYILRGDIALI